MRRANYSGQFLGNTSKKEVHDLDKETTDCQIDKIVAAGHAKSFASHAAAKTAGYDDCEHCLADSRR